MKYIKYLVLVLFFVSQIISAQNKEIHQSNILPLNEMTQGAVQTLTDEGLEINLPEIKHYTGWTELGTPKGGNAQFVLKGGDKVVLSFTPSPSLNGTLSVAAYGGFGLPNITPLPFMGNGETQTAEFFVPYNLSGKALTSGYWTFYNNVSDGKFILHKAYVIRPELNEEKLPTGAIISNVLYINQKTFEGKITLSEGQILTVNSAGNTNLTINGKSVKGHYVSENEGEISVKVTSDKEIYNMAIYNPPLNNRLDADKILAETQPAHLTKCENVNGAMAITIDGEAVSPMGWSAIIPVNQPTEYVNDMVNKSSFNIARCMVFLGTTYLGYGPNTQYSPVTYDYEYIDRELNRILDCNPQSKLILQVDIDGCDWFLKENPDVVGDNPKMPDFLHPKWLEFERDMLRQFVAHIQTNERFNNSVIGYQIMNGTTLDCGFDITLKKPEALKRFRAMLKEKYKSNTNLQKAWNNKKVTFSNAECDNKCKENDLLLLAPGENAQYMDTVEFIDRSNAQSLLYFCKCIKEATNNRVITGARAGNFYVGAWVPPFLANGGTDFRTLMESPYIDYLENWEPYPGRWTGYNGGGDSANPVHAMLGYGKMHMLQNDVRTHTGPDRGYGACKDEPESIVKQKKVFVNSLINGQQEYLWQMDYHFNTPGLMDLWHQIQKIYTKSFDLPRQSSQAEIAYVLDIDYQYYLGIDTKFTEPTRGFAIVDYPRFLFGRAGVPYETIFIDQLKDYDKYKVYVFFLTSKFDKKTIKLIEEEIFKKGKTAIFLWGSGLIDESNKYNPDQMKKLTGMNITVENKEVHWSSVPCEDFAKEMGISPDYEMGTIRFPEPNLHNPNIYTFNPYFSIKDKNVTPIATYRETGDVAIACKKAGKGNVIYCGTVYPAPALVRYALKLSGSHIYTDTEDYLYMNDSFIGFSTTQFTDEINLKLKEATPLYDLFNDVEYASGTEFKLKVNPRDTYLFFKGTKAEFYK
ncbi:MAG: hypothetical protein KBT47_02430 [Armatimonadetes bacterium]|nr:hypothetical protein [Candidatus Hippobium faecium]